MTINVVLETYNNTICIETHNKLHLHTNALFMKKWSIFEKIMYNLMKDFIEKHKLLHYSQYGLRRAHSTQHAILDIVEVIHKIWINVSFMRSVYRSKEGV